jgi:YidC/Oxa1 family membrane protein insertase
MINYIRFFLYGAILVVAFLLFQSWQEERQARLPSATTTQPSTQIVPPGEIVPSSTVIHNLKQLHAVSHQKPTVSKPHQLIHIQTPLLMVDVDMHGGEIVRTALVKYAKTRYQNEPVVLLNDQPGTFYIAKDGLMQAGEATQHDVLTYRAKQTNYTWVQGQKSLVIPIEARTKQGLLVTKTLTFKPDTYVIQIDMTVKNASLRSWSGNYFMQLSRNSTTAARKKILGRFSSFFGIAVSSDQKPYQKHSFKSLQKENYSDNIRGGWLAMLQHYFLGAWIPNANDTYHYYTRFNSDGICSAGMVSQQLTLKPGDSHTFQGRFYSGPKITSRLRAIAPHLELTVDYSSIAFFSILSQFLFRIMNLIHKFVGNWGWSIILVTLLIRLAFYRLSAVSYKSMVSMRRLQPKVKQLKERYGSDRQKLQQAVMELYRKEKINPLGGCLPMLIQIPVFLALYWVLIESVELRQAPFIMWIQDLSVRDPYYLLPILMGLSMFIQQKLGPQANDPTQAKVMLFLPLVLTLLFLKFPAGLVLYWVVNNLFSIAQQWYVTKKYSHPSKRLAYKK